MWGKATLGAASRKPKEIIINLNKLLLIFFIFYYKRDVI